MTFSLTFQSLKVKVYDVIRKPTYDFLLVNTYNYMLICIGSELYAFEIFPPIRPHYLKNFSAVKSERTCQVHSSLVTCSPMYLLLMHFYSCMSILSVWPLSYRLLTLMHVLTHVLFTHSLLFMYVFDLSLYF